MKRIHYFVAGLLLAIGAGAWAQIVPGGLPSRPTFQNVKVVGAGPQTSLRGSTGSAGASLAWAEFSDSTGLRNGYIGHTLPTATVIESDVGDIKFIPLASTGRLFWSQDGGSTFLGLPKVSFGKITGTAGACTLSGTWQSQNIASCTRNSVGNYSVNFSVAYAGSPVCSAGPDSALAAIAGVNTAGTTSVTVQVGTTAFAAQDANVWVTCNGF